MKKLITFSLALLGSINFSFSQLAIDSAEKKITINFNDFKGAGFSPNPAAGQLDSDTWSVLGMSDGVLNFGDTQITTATDFARGIHNGFTSSGGIYAFNTGNNIMLGVQPIGSDFTPGAFILKMQNFTADTIRNLYVEYDIFSLNDQGRSSVLNFSYSFDNLNYTNMPQLNFSTDDTADVSASWSISRKKIMITGIALADSSFFYLKWTGDDSGGSGSRDEYGIDNIILMANPKPVTASFTANNVCEGLPVFFNNVSFSPMDSIVSYKWSFGDSFTDSIQAPSHMYASYGTYNVTLAVKTAGGHTDTLVNLVKVYSNPDAEISFSPHSGCGVLNAFFSDSSRTTDGVVAAMFWNFGDTLSGALNTDSVFSPAHLYSSYGTYTVLHTVVTSYGCSDYDIDSVIVNPFPQAGFTFSISAGTVTFSDSSTISQGNIISYDWYFGDGDTSTAIYPVHSYTASGTYNVTLIIISDAGCSDTISKLVNIVFAGVDEEPQRNLFTLFPNPLYGEELTIMPVQNLSNARMVIVNSLGQIVFERSAILLQPTKLNVDFPAGVYTVSLIGDNYNISEKLIIR